ncbi:hypothetical protein ABK046_33605 [Streptomyces caeruleatus]
MANWPGDVEAASLIAGWIVDNAARHGSPFSDGRIILRMEVMEESRELRIYADDADPTFPNFDQVVEGSAESESGLWWVAGLGGRVSWHLKRDEGGPVLGKAVQVVLPAPE